VSGVLLLVCIVSFLFLQSSQGAVRGGVEKDAGTAQEGGGTGTGENSVAELFTSSSATEEQTGNASFAASKENGRRLVVRESSDTPAASAKAYLVSDVFSGDVLLEQRATEKLPIASITKLLTALVAEERVGLETRIFFEPDAQYYSVNDLLRPLFLRSNNTVAEDIALYLGEQRFVEYMEAYAKQIGMYHTNFADTSGLSAGNVSTAADLSVLADFLVREKKYLLDVTKEQDTTIASMSGYEWRMENQNKLSSDPYFVGGKLGYTDEALQTALSIFTIPVHGEMHTVAVVVLGSYDWKQDTRTLLQWLLKHVEVVDSESEY